MNQTLMIRKESLISFEAWQNIANSCKHFNKLIKVFAELTCDLSALDISMVELVDDR